MKEGRKEGEEEEKKEVGKEGRRKGRKKRVKKGVKEGNEMPHPNCTAMQLLCSADKNPKIQIKNSMKNSALNTGAS